MAVPFSNNLTMYRGQYVQLNTALTNPPSSFTGYDFVFMAKSSTTDADSNAILKKTYSNSGGITLAQLNSIWTLTTLIHTADTRMLSTSLQVLYWEIKSVDASLQEIPLDGGSITVYPDIASATT